MVTLDEFKIMQAPRTTLRSKIACDYIRFDRDQRDGLGIKIVSIGLTNQLSTLKLNNLGWTQD